MCRRGVELHLAPAAPAAAAHFVMAPARLGFAIPSLDPELGPASECEVLRRPSNIMIRSPPFDIQVVIVRQTGEVPSSTFENAIIRDVRRRHEEPWSASGWDGGERLPGKRSMKFNYIYRWRCSGVARLGCPGGETAG